MHDVQAGMRLRVRLGFIREGRTGYREGSINRWCLEKRQGSVENWTAFQASLVVFSLKPFCC